MIRAFAILTFYFIVAGQLRAAEATAPAAKPAPEAGAAMPQATPVPKLELKHRSSFKIENSIRNPFWPIGWKPSTKISDGADQAGPEVPPSAFRLSSIAVETGGRFAIINGRVMEEGQTFGLQLGNQTYQITVKTIEDGRVILARRDQEIVVPLSRK